MNKKVSKALEFLPKAILQREETFLGRQQIYVFVYYTIAVLVGLVFTFIGAGGPQSGLYLTVNSIYFGVVVLVFAGYFFRVIKLRPALNCVVMTMQLATSFEMINCAFSPDEYHLMLIVGNMVLLAVNILLSLIAYLEIIPIVLCVLSMGTYIACVLITKNASLANFAAIFLVVFVVTSMLGLHMVYNTRSLDKENQTLKKEEEDVFELLGQSREQVLAYIEISKGKKEWGETKALLDMVSDKGRHNIVVNLKEYLAVKETRELELKEIFPELTRSEIEMCLLILQGKTLGKLCTILGKKESNVTCTRTHIRRKLNLKPEDDLRKSLQARVDAVKQASAAAAAAELAALSEEEPEAEPQETPAVPADLQIPQNTFGPRRTS